MPSGANLLWQSTPDLRCAAVDFQYCGSGYGMQDVAYFMTSAVAGKVCQCAERQHCENVQHTRVTGGAAARGGAVAALPQHADGCVGGGRCRSVHVGGGAGAF